MNIRWLAALTPILLINGCCLRGLDRCIQNSSNFIRLCVLTRFTLRFGPNQGTQLPLLPFVPCGWEPGLDPAICNAPADPLWVTLIDFGPQTSEGLPVTLGLRVQAPLGRGLLPRCGSPSLFGCLRILAPAWPGSATWPAADPLSPPPTLTP